MKNLFDFCDENIENEINEAKSNNSSKDNIKTNNEDVKKAYNQYKDLSQEELVNEFLSKSKEQLKNGNLSFEKLDKIANDISPMLNDNQKQFLSNLFGKLKNE